MRRLPALSLLACLLLAACDRAPAPEAGTAAPPVTAPSPVPAAAAADPAQAVRVASERLAGLRSFHAELDLLGAAQPVHSAMDFVAPDRFRVQTPAGTQTIIGDTMFLQAGGAIQQVPSPPGLLEQWRSPLPADAPTAALQAEDLGRQSLDGVDTRHYRLQGAGGERLEYWVDDQGLPRQIVRNGSNQGRPYQLRLRYSRFNDPALRIDLP
jgi:hypothetical protein